MNKKEYNKLSKRVIEEYKEYRKKLLYKKDIDILNQLMEEDKVKCPNCSFSFGPDILKYTSLYEDQVIFIDCPNCNYEIHRYFAYGDFAYMEFLFILYKQIMNAKRNEFKTLDKI